MKSWSKTIEVGHALTQVQLASPATRSTCQSNPLEELRNAEREKLAYQRGREEGQRELSNQILQQRSEIQAVQHGVLQSLQNVIPELIHQSEPMLIELAVEVARKLVAEMPISQEMI